MSHCIIQKRFSDVWLTSDDVKCRKRVIKRCVSGSVMDDIDDAVDNIVHLNRY